MMDSQEIDIENAWSPSGGMDDDMDVTMNAAALSRALIKLLHSTTNPNPEDVMVTLKFDFYSDVCEVVEEI